MRCRIYPTTITSAQYDRGKAEAAPRLRLDAALRHAEQSGLFGAPMIPPSCWRGDRSSVP
jgi:GntR family transcriptional repressor for pyruvate dehydrogenase complex